MARHSASHKMELQRLQHRNNTIIQDMNSVGLAAAAYQQPSAPADPDKLFNSGYGHSEAQLQYGDRGGHSTTPS